MGHPNEYDVGDYIQITGTFRSQASVLTNPSTVAAAVRTPNGSLITPSPAMATTGIWTAEVSIDNQPGMWRYRWSGTGGLQAAGENVFKVRRSEVL